MTSASEDRGGAEAFAEDVFLGESAPARRLRLQVARIAPHFRSTLVVGEPGAGKRTVAEALHRLSPMCALEFRAVALEQLAGRDDALEGTLYLSGLERLGMELQVELAKRVRCPERKYRLVLGSECEPRGMIAAGRMGTVLAAAMEMPVVRVAALRERANDFEEIASEMLRRTGAGASFATAALQQLRAYSWPGNLTELSQVCARVARPGCVIEVQDLPLLGGAGGEPALRLDEVIARHVRDVLQRCAGNKLKAAEVLGISRSTLYRMLEA